MFFIEKQQQYFLKGIFTVERALLLSKELGAGQFQRRGHTLFNSPSP